jgi:hypothetical protein
MARWTWFVIFLVTRIHLLDFSRLSVSFSSNVGPSSLIKRQSHGTGHGVGHYLNVHEGTTSVFDQPPRRLNYSN